MQYLTSGSDAVFTGNAPMTINRLVVNGTTQANISNPFGAVFLNVPAINNNGLISATGAINVTGATGLVVSGNGTYNSANITTGTTFTATTGILELQTSNITVAGNNTTSTIVGPATLAALASLGSIKVDPGVSFGATNTLTVNTPALQNGGTLLSVHNGVQVVGQQNLLITQGGTISSQTGGQKSVLQALNGDVNLQSSLGFVGVGEMDAQQGRILISSGANLTATSDLTLNTSVVGNNGNIMPQGGSFPTGGLVTFNGSNGIAVVGSGTINSHLSITLQGGSGAVVSTQNQLLQTVNAFGSSVNIVSTAPAVANLLPNGGLAVGQMTASNGGISLTTGSGDLIILAARQITATGGDIIFQNNDSTGTGTIQVQQAVQISETSSSSTVGGRVIFTFGAPPQPPVSGSAPTYQWSGNASAGGNIFYGAGFDTSNSPSTSNALNQSSVSGGVLIFAGRSSSAVKMFGNDNISIQGQAPKLTSLDLTNATTAGAIQTAQLQGRLLGLLTLDPTSGAATGGTLIAQPVNYAAAGVSVLDIPQGVTLTNKNFGANNAFTISSATSALVAGSLLFSQASTQQVMTSNVTVNVSGTLSSAGGLTINAPKVVNTSTIEAAGTAAGSRDLVVNTSTLTNSGSMISDFGSVNASGQSGITISGGGNLTASTVGQTVTVGSQFGTVSFTGNQTLLGAGVINAPAVSIASSVTVSAQNGFNVNSGNLSNSGILTTTTGQLSVAGTNGLNISGSGNLSGAAGTSLSAGSGALNASQNAYGIDFTAQGRSVSVAATSGMTVGAVTATGGSASLSAGTGLLKLESGALANVTDGDLTLQNFDSTNGSIEIGSGVHINITSNTSASGGRMLVYVGNAPSQPQLGTAPSSSSWSASSSAGGNVFYGALNPTFNAGGNSASVTGGVLVFNNSSGRAQAIRLDGQDTVTINGVAPTLSSLDLSSTSNISSIVTLLNAGRLIGQFTLNGNGTLASGSSLILQPVNIPSAGVAALNVPVGVTLTGQAFNDGVGAIKVAGTNTSTVAGTLNFAGSQSQGVVTLSGNLTVSGTLSSAGSLTINWPSSSGSVPTINNVGTVSALGGNLALASNNGLALAGSGSFSSGSGSATTLTANSGNLTIGGSNTVVGPAVVNAPNGSVVVQNAASLTASTDNLTVNTPTLNLQGSLTASGTLTAQASSALTGLTILGSGTLTAALIDLSGGTGIGSSGQNISGMLSNTTFSLSGQPQPLGQPILNGPVELFGEQVNMTFGGTLNLQGLRTTGGLDNNGQPIHGDANIYVESGALQVSPNANLYVAGGNLLLENDDLAHGNISFGQGAQVSVVSSGSTGAGGFMTVTMGAPLQSNTTNAPDPSTWSVTNVIPAQGQGTPGTIYYGDNGIDTSNSSSQNTVYLNQGTITFNGNSSHAISFAGGVKLSVIKGIVSLGSLDLTDGSSDLQLILNDEALGSLTGTISDINGVVSGQLLLTPQNIGSSNAQGVITSIKIPVGVQLDLQNFLKVTPISVLNNGEVTIGGAINFTGSSSGAVINALAPAGGAATIGAAGSITSGGSLTLNMPAIVIQGNGTSAGQLVAQNGALNINGANGLSITGPSQGPAASLSGSAGVNLTAANGSLSIAGLLSSTGVTTVSAQGTNAAVNLLAGASLASSVNLAVLTSTLANAGTLSSTNGSVAVTGANSLDVSGGGTISATTAGQSVALSALAGTLSFSGSQSFGGVTSLVASGTNNAITVAASSLLSGSDNLTLSAGSLTNAGGISSAGTLAVSNSSGFALNGPGSLSGANGLVFSSSKGAVSVSQGSLSGAINASGLSVFVSSSGSGATVAGLSTNSGSAVVQVGAGDLVVNPGITISVNEGDLVLENDNVPAGQSQGGTIQIGNGVTVNVKATSIAGGRIVLTMGPQLTPPSAGSAPGVASTVWQASAIQGANIFYGDNADSFIGNGNQAAVAGGVLILQASSNSNSIQIGSDVSGTGTTGGVNLSIHAVAPALTNLDLSNNSGVSGSVANYNQILTDINQGRLIGTVASGNISSLTLTPYNYANSGLSALNIPLGVTVTNVGLGAVGQSQPNVSLHGSSAGVIAGTYQFQNSSNYLNFTSSVDLQVSGTVSADSPLLISTPSITNSGLITSNGDPGHGLEIDSSSITNLPSGTISGQFVNLGGVSSLVNQGLITSTGAVAVGGYNVNISGGGTISASNLISIQPTYSFNFVGSQQFNSSFGTSLSSILSGNVSSAATLTSNGPLNISVLSGTFNNSGAISSTGGKIDVSGYSQMFVTGTGTMSSVYGVSFEAQGFGQPQQVSVSQTGITGPVSATGSNVTINTANGITLQNIVASAGNASITVGTGVLQVAAADIPNGILNGGSVSATNGEVILQNNDANAGTISFGLRSSVHITTVNGRVGGRLVVSIGSLPAPPVAGSAPCSPNCAGWTVNNTDFGNVFYGTNGISFGATSGNQLTIDGGVAIFNTGSQPASSISLGGQVNFNVKMPPPTFSSLDLTDTSVTSDIVALQNQGKVLGQLLTNNTGAYGGNLILNPLNINPTGLSALNIPVGVTVTNNSFSSSTPITIHNSSTAIINGTEQFITAGVGGSGLLRATGAVSIAGSVTSDGFLTLGGLTINNTGTISASNGGVALFAASITNRSIIQAAGGGITLASSIISNTGSLSAPGYTVALTGTNGLSISGQGGTVSGASVQYIAIAGPISIFNDQNVTGLTSMTANSPTGSVQIGAGVKFSADQAITITTPTLNNAGIINSSNGGVTITSQLGQTALTVLGGGTISSAPSKTIFLQGSSIDFQGSQIFNGSATLETLGSGSVQVENGFVLTASNGLILNTNQVTNNGSIVTTSGQISVQGIGFADMQIGGSGTLSGAGGINLHAAGGNINLSQNSVVGAITASAQGLSVSTNTGGLTIQSAVASNGSVSFQTGTGSILLNAGGTASATNGELSFETDDVANGTIEFGAGSTLATTAALGVAGGIIVASIGPLQTVSQGVAPSAPNWNTNFTNGGIIFYGNNGIAANLDAQNHGNTANVNGGTVIFASNAPGRITFDGGVTLNAQSSGAILPSLDLTNSAIQAYVIAQQGAGRLGGQLTLNNGIASGTVSFGPSNITSAALSAVDIPGGVEVDATNFGLTNPLKMSSSATNSILIGGTLAFISTNNNPGSVYGVINNTGSGQIQVSGALTSVGGLSVLTSSLQNSGTIAANGGLLTITGAQGLALSGQGGTLTGATGINVQATNNAITITGSQSLNGVATFTAVGNNGAINIGSGAVLSGAGNVNLATGALSSFGSVISANGAVNLLALNGLTITGQGLLSGAAGVNLSVLAGNLLVEGSHNISGQGTITLASNAIANLTGTLTDDSSLAFYGDTVNIFGGLSAPTLNMSVRTINNQGLLQGTLNLSAPSVNINDYSGDLVVNRLDVGGAAIYVNSGNFTYTGDITTLGNSIDIATPAGAITINGAINTSAFLFPGRGGDVDLQARNSVTVTGTITTLGNQAQSGHVFIEAQNGGAFFNANGWSPAIIVSNIDTSSRNSAGGDVIVLNAGSVGGVFVGSINTSAGGFNSAAGSVAVTAPAAISVGANASGQAAITTNAINGRSGSIFLSSGAVLTGAAGQSIVVGSAFNTLPIRTGSDASVVLMAGGDIRLGPVVYNSISTSSQTYGGVGIFPEISPSASTYNGINTFQGFPTAIPAPQVPAPSNSVDSNSYNITVTPQGVPTISDGTHTWVLPAGNFSQLAIKQSLNTAGGLTVATNGDAGLLVPISMPYMIVTGGIRGLAGANGSAAPLVLFAENDMTLATGGQTITSIPTAGVVGASAGNIYIASGAGSPLVQIGGAAPGTVVVQASLPTNTVSSNGGSVSIMTETAKLNVAGDIVTSGTGSGLSGEIELTVPLAPSIEQVVLTAGNLNSNNIVLGNQAADGGRVIVLAGSSVQLGNVITSSTFAGHTAGSVTIEADQITQYALQQQLAQFGVINAGNIIAAGLQNANGGDILLDAGRQVFNVGSLVTRSTTSNNVNFYLSDTGAGQAGALTFATGAASGMTSPGNGRIVGTVAAGAGYISLNPTISFGGGSAVLVDGTNTNNTSSLTGTLAGVNNIGDIATVNLGTGRAGSLVLFGSSTGMILGNVSTVAAHNESGDVLLSNMQGGDLRTGTITTSASGAGNQTGRILISNNSGSIYVGNLTAQASAGAMPATVNLTAAQGVYSAAVLGSNISLDSPDGTANGGNLTIVAGGDNGLGTAIFFGAINLSGASGGRALIASTDVTAAPITLGSITGTAIADSGAGATVGIAGTGDINLGLISLGNSSNTATASAVGGSLFVGAGGNINDSAGMDVAGTALLSGALYLVQSGAAMNAQNLRAGLTQTSSGFVNNFLYVRGLSNGPNVPGSHTQISLSGVSGYNPAGYSGTSVGSFSVDTGSDGNVIVPLLFLHGVQTGDITSFHGTHADSVTLVAGDNLAVNTVNTSGIITGGNITLASARGSVTVGNINSSEPLVAGGATAGNIYISALNNNVVTNAECCLSQDINLTGASTGGNLLVMAGTGILFNHAISTSGGITGGNIDLLTISNNVVVSTPDRGDAGRYIDTTSAGTPGNIDVLIGRGPVVGAPNGPYLVGEGAVTGDSGFVVYNHILCCVENSINLGSSGGTGGNFTINEYAAAQSEGGSASLNIFTSSAVAGGNVYAFVRGNINQDWSPVTSAANAGNITILSEGGVTLTGSMLNTSGSSLGGNITVSALAGGVSLPGAVTIGGTRSGNIKLTAFRSVSSDTLNTSSLGSAGNIDIGVIWGNAVIGGAGILSNAGIGTGGTANVIIGIPMATGAGSQGLLTTNVDLTSSSGDGGNLNYLQAYGDYICCPPNTDIIININTSAFYGSAGSVNIDVAGNISVPVAISALGQLGGNVSVAAGGTLSLGDGIDTNGAGLAGNIAVSSLGGVASLGGGADGTALAALGGTRGGSIIITSAGSLSAGGISAASNGIGGSVGVVIGQGSVNVPAIDVSGVNGAAGDIDISIQTTAQGGSGVNTFNASSAYGSGGSVRIMASNGSLTLAGQRLDVSSIYGRGGSVLLLTGSAAGNNLSVALPTYATGQAGGAVNMIAGGAITETNTVDVSGASSNAGVVNMIAGGNVSDSGGIFANALAAGNGGGIRIQSLTGSITITGSPASALVSAVGKSAGGQVTLIAQSGLNLSTVVDASSNGLNGAGTGGLIEAVSLAANSAIALTGAALKVSGAGAGGLVSLVSGGVISTANVQGQPSLIDASSQAGSGGRTFISAGSAVSLPSIITAGGSDAGYELVLAGGAVGGQTTFSVSGNVGIYPFIGSNNSYAGGVFNSAAAAAGDNYVISVGVNSLPSVQDTTSGVTYAMSPGVISGNLTVGTVQVSNAGGGLLAPLVVAGNFTSSPLSSSGGAPLSVIAAGNLTVSGDVFAAQSGSATPPILLTAYGALSVAGSVSTASTGSAGAVSLSGSSVIVSGYNSSIYAGASINTASTGTNFAGGAVNILSFNGGTTIGNWLSESLYSGGNIFSGAVGNVGAAGDIFIGSLGRTRLNDIVALGENNAAAGAIVIQGNAGGTIASLAAWSVGAPYNPSFWGTGNYLLFATENRTVIGTGIANGIELTGAYLVAPNSSFLESASNGSTRNSFTLNLAAGTGAVQLSDISTFNRTGSSGSVAVYANNPLGLTTGNVDTSSASQAVVPVSGGTVVLTNSLGSLTVGAGLKTSGTGIFQRSGDIALASSGGIDISNGDPDASATAGAASGRVTVVATSSVSNGFILSGSTGGGVTSGDVFVESRTGNVGSASFNVDASGYQQASGGNIVLAAPHGSVAAGQITSVGTGAGMIAGSYRVAAQNGITQSSFVSLAGVQGADGGAVQLSTLKGVLNQESYIDVSGDRAGGVGNGGTVLLQSFFGSVMVGGSIYASRAGSAQ
jgi:hypothetical protein